jgi:hypothetical protein
MCAQEIRGAIRPNLPAWSFEFAGVPQEVAQYGMLVGRRSVYSRALLQTGLIAH